MLHAEKALPPFIRLGKALVMEKAGRVTSLLVRSRNTAGMMVVSPSAPLPLSVAKKCPATQVFLLPACLRHPVSRSALHIVFVFFAYFLFPIHYTLIFQGCKSYQSMRSFLTHKKTDALVIHHSEGIQTF